MKGYEFFAGLVLGLLADWFIKPWLTKKWAGLKRWIKRRFRKKYPELGYTVMLGNNDTGVCLVLGNGEQDISPQEIRVSMNAAKPDMDVPENVVPLIAEVAKEEAAKKRQALPHAWNGQMLHICKFTAQNTANKETPQLFISLQKGDYYHFLATSARLHAAYANGSPDTSYWELRRLLIGEFSAWRTSVPPACLVGLPANIHIFVETETLGREAIVFSTRSGSVAIAPHEVAAAVNENAHAENDFERDRMDIGWFATRALKEETGWDDSEHSGGVEDPKSEMHWLLFAADTQRVAFGLIGYAHLPITIEDLVRLFNERCADRRETKTFISVPAKLKDLCRFIHEKRLYNSVGVGALYSLMHRKGISYADIQNEFYRLQKPPTSFGRG